jgi:hypothetical protein
MAAKGAEKSERPTVSGVMLSCSSAHRSDVELIFERDQKGRVTRLGYSVNNRKKSDKTLVEFQALVEKLVGALGDWRLDC